MNSRFQQGASPALVMVVAVIVLFVLGGIIYATLPKTPDEQMPQDGQSQQTQTPDQIQDEMVDESNEEMNATPPPAPPAGQNEEQNPPPVSFTGQILAGTATPVIDFNESDYNQALANKELVVLYFYANWCPICREEIPKMYSAFDKLDEPNVVAFRVNFNDSDTDSNEEDLARQFGVAYQHTKVFLKNSERILKSPETWDQDRYLSEINNALTN